VFVDVDVDITGSAELNNGWTASLTYGLELDDNGGDYSDVDFNDDDNLTLSLYNDVFAFTYGDTEWAPVSYWNGVSEMNADGFSEVDGEAVLKVTGSFGGVEGGISAGVDEETGETYSLGFGAKATFGMVDVSAAYQEETDAVDSLSVANQYDNFDDFNASEVYGLSLSTTLAGAEFTLAYAKTTGGFDADDANNDGDFNDAGEITAKAYDTESIGLEVSYPVGPVTLGAFYVSEDTTNPAGIDDTYGVSAAYADGPITAKVYYKEIKGSEEYGLGATYDMGTGLTLTGGYIDGDSATDNDFAGYVVAEYDLGGGASFLASYADANNAAAADTDDIDTVTGGYELFSGATLALTLKF